MVRVHKSIVSSLSVSAAVPEIVTDVSPAGLIGSIGRARSHFGDESFAPSNLDVVDMDDFYQACAALRTQFGKRLYEVVLSPATIMVFGDYDADGLCSAASLFAGLVAARCFIRSRTCIDLSSDLVMAGELVGIKVMVPERSAGYGLSVEAVPGFVVDGIDVVVACDNGANAIEAVKAAELSGIDVLVIDHHPVSPENAAFWVDTRRHIMVNPSCDGDHADLLLRFVDDCQVCASFLVDIVLRELFDRSRTTVDLHYFTVFGGIATVTDVMPMNCLNRSVVGAALALLSAGFGALSVRELFRARLVKDRVITDVLPPGLPNDVVDSDFFGFWLGPRLNAFGRMGFAGEGLAYLLAPESAISSGTAAVESFNDERRLSETVLIGRLEPLVALLEDGGADVFGVLDAPDREIEISSRLVFSSVADESSFVVGVPGVFALFVSDICDEGIAGLVAGRLASRLRYPVAMFSRQISDSGRYRLVGSGRVSEGGLFSKVSAGAIATLIFSSAGGRGGGHSAAFGARFDVAVEWKIYLRCLRWIVEQFCGHLLRAVDALESDVVGFFRRVGFGPEWFADYRCDLAIANGDLTYESLRALRSVGPFGQGFRAPLVFVPFRCCSLRALGQNGAFSLDFGGGTGSNRYIGFVNRFAGGLPALEAQGVGRVMRENGCGVIGRVKPIYFNFQKNTPRNGRVPVEMIIDAIVERVPCEVAAEMELS